MTIWVLWNNAPSTVSPRRTIHLLWTSGGIWTSSVLMLSWLSNASQNCRSAEPLSSTTWWTWRWTLCCSTWECGSVGTRGHQSPVSLPLCSISSTTCEVVNQPGCRSCSPPCPDLNYLSMFGSRGLCPVRDSQLCCNKQLEVVKVWAWLHFSLTEQGLLILYSLQWSAGMWKHSQWLSFHGQHYAQYWP